MKVLPSLKQLEYLTALADFEHFGKASEACNVTPSTLSAGIRDLEAVIGVSLAERTKRHVLMTPLGVEIAERARMLLRYAEDIMELAAAHKEPLSGDMKLGVIPTIGPFLLPRVLPNLREDYPKLRLYLREEQTEILLDRLHKGELDAALIALPYDIKGFDSVTLFDDPFLFACQRGHDLAKFDVIDHDDLIGQPLLLLEEGHCLRGHAMEACHISENKLKAEFEATSLHTLIQMVAAGLGVTLLPQIAVDAGLLTESAITTVALASNAMPRKIALVWRSSSSRIKEFRLLAKLLASW